MADADITESVTAPLVRAILLQQDAYRDAIDKLRELTAPQGAEQAEQVHELTSLLREAVELAGVLRRAVPSLSREQLHRAFGAPGDYGYETALGAALAQVYSVPTTAVLALPAGEVPARDGWYRVKWRVATNAPDIVHWDGERVRDGSGKRQSVTSIAAWGPSIDALEADAGKWRAVVDGITRREAPCETPADVFELLDGVTEALRLMHERTR